MSKQKLNLKLRDAVMLIGLVLVMAVPGLNTLPVIDRDEARYAQASVQMIETGDYINIRFQDRAVIKNRQGRIGLKPQVSISCLIANLGKYGHTESQAFSQQF